MKRNIILLTVLVLLGIAGFSFSGSFFGGAGSGSGDVSGPSSSTDNGIPTFDGTGGKTLQDSDFVADDIPSAVDGATTQHTGHLILPKGGVKDLGTPNGDPSLTWADSTNSGFAWQAISGWDENLYAIVGGKWTMAWYAANAGDIPYISVIANDIHPDYGGGVTTINSGNSNNPWSHVYGQQFVWGEHPYGETAGIRQIFKQGNANDGFWFDTSVAKTGLFRLALTDYNPGSGAGTYLQHLWVAGTPLWAITLESKSAAAGTGLSITSGATTQASANGGDFTIDTGTGGAGGNFGSLLLKAGGNEFIKIDAATSTVLVEGNTLTKAVTGDDGKYLKYDNATTSYVWDTPSAGGTDLTGTQTDNYITRGNGTDTVQTSTWSIDDTTGLLQNNYTAGDTIIQGANAGDAAANNFYIKAPSSTSASAKAGDLYLLAGENSDGHSWDENDRTAIIFQTDGGDGVMYEAGRFEYTANYRQLTLPQAIAGTTTLKVVAGSTLVCEGKTDGLYMNLSLVGNAGETLDIGYNSSSYRFRHGYFTGDVYQGASVKWKTSVSLTADDTSVSADGRSFISLSSDNATKTSRTFAISTTNAIEGQTLTLIWVDPANCGGGSDPCLGEVADSGNMALSTGWDPTGKDTLSLIFDGTDWVETGRSTN
jgi:hypothetical protein